MEEEQKPAQKPSAIDEAKELVERMERANKERAALLDREEQMKAEAMLSGRSVAGQEPEEPREETPQEYKDRVMRGEL